MPINPEAVGTLSDPQVTSWTSKDSLLYAVGVGAGQDPTDKRDLPFVTENSNGVKQAALPTQAVTLVDFTPAFVNIGSFNPAMLVHGEQKVVLHQQVPAEGSASSTCEISAIWDKGKGAVVELTSRSVDPETGDPLFDMIMSAYIRGEGGWGGDRGPTGSPNAAPEREPDLVLVRPPGQNRPSSIGSVATEIHFTPIRPSLPSPASTARSSMVCAPTASRVERSCTLSVTPTPHGWDRSRGVSPRRCSRARPWESMSGTTPTGRSSGCVETTIGLSSTPVA